MIERWKSKPGNRIVRHPRQDQISPVTFTVTSRRHHSRALSSPLVLVYVFAGLITVGTIFLLLPFSHNTKIVVNQVNNPNHQISLTQARERDSDAYLGQKLNRGFTPFVDAVFTATSAATVTGLTTRDTSTYWSRSGQIMIMVLIYIGGLGFMSIVTFLLIIGGQRMTLSQRLLIKDNYQIEQIGGLARVTVNIVLFATGIQLAGMIAFFLRFSLDSDFTVGEGIWQSLFQSVSAFNSAGFVSLPETNSLSAYQDDIVVLAITGVLILLGSVSYFVVVDTVRFRKFSLFSLNTKLVLVATLILTGVGTIFFLSTEYSNPETLGALGLGQRIVVSLFETISGRTAGFSIVDYSLTEKPTNIVMAGLMFVGGASGSVSGGIKVNTLAVSVVAIVAAVKGNDQASVFQREVSPSQVQSSMTIGAIATIFLFLVTLLLTFSESGGGVTFIDLFFESVSASATNGLSTGATSDMSRIGHLIVVGAMFIGKLGAPTLALVMVQKGRNDIYRYAQERVTMG